MTDSKAAEFAQKDASNWTPSADFRPETHILEKNAIGTRLEANKHRDRTRTLSSGPGNRDRVSDMI